MSTRYRDNSAGCAACTQQEVTDAEGRRRFHGAFTGGYSAGYYNTVGSAEGWAPSTFKSSRDSRAASQCVTAAALLFACMHYAARLHSVAPGSGS